ncbi:hypothetical protein FSB73_02860 [Arachidicoccus ginsenosidivorans]|uniref:Uncharacterized protein n=1 Tax=Arachidicoccus ginsenosidivorans TaxID=496057 RepID=A0A5B8VIM0_9BACT|nr:hypothetical protein [Arachidicoccus ginsenosidivorans]QEC70782.1 hypothetical protein FSB73_02860 [Arachidicoccus ginsenosidivorans]
MQKRTLILIGKIVIALFLLVLAFWGEKIGQPWKSILWVITVVVLLGIVFGNRYKKAKQSERY